MHTIALGLISAPAPVHQGAPTFFEDEKKLLHVILFLTLLVLQKGLLQLGAHVHQGAP